MKGHTGEQSSVTSVTDARQPQLSLGAGTMVIPRPSVDQPIALTIGRAEGSLPGTNAQLEVLEQITSAPGVQFCPGGSEGCESCYHPPFKGKKQVPRGKLNIPVLAAVSCRLEIPNITKVQGLNSVWR